MNNTAARRIDRPSHCQKIIDSLLVILPHRTEHIRPRSFIAYVGSADPCRRHTYYQLLFMDKTARSHLLMCGIDGWFLVNMVSLRVTQARIISQVANLGHVYATVNGPITLAMSRWFNQVIFGSRTCSASDGKCRGSGMRKIVRFFSVTANMLLLRT